jgi:hypothetical protein
MTLAALPRLGEVVETSRQADDMVMWSVTTVISAVTPLQDRLIPWAVGITAERTVEQLDTLIARLNNEGAESAVQFVKGLRWQLGGRLSDTELGTVAHHLFCQYALTGVRPEVAPELHPKFSAEGATLHADDVRDLRAMLIQFDRWLQGWQPDYWATEVVVYHPGMGFAGQADGFLSVEGVPVIVDYKTSRKTFDSKGNVRPPYAECAPQLAAYRHCTHAAVWRARRYSNRSRRYYLLNDAERAAAVPVPEVEAGLAIKITPDHLGVHAVQCGPDVFDAFCFMLETARWHFNQAAHAIGKEMTPPFPAPEAADDVFAGLPVY